MSAPTTSTFKEDLPKLWGNWGVSSEIGKLRDVLMRRPGKEIENINDPKALAMRQGWDPEKVRYQHDVIADIYRQNGINVHYIEEMGTNMPNGIYVRDLVFMTPEGAIITRPAVECRVGEEVYAAKQLIKLGVPIIKTINGRGIFEGACALWLDRETVLFGYGYRCNSSGTAQVEEELRNMGVKNIIKVEIPRGVAHLDSFLAIADYKVALALRMVAPNTLYEELYDRGFNIIDVPSMEEFRNFCQNFVAIEPGKIIMPEGNPKTANLLEKAGVEVIQVDMSEIMKGNGAIHCMTAFLNRDDVPLYKK